MYILKVCMDDHLLWHKKPCLVYSFGVSTDWSFESDLIRFQPNCEIHMFDPTVPTEVSLDRQLPQTVRCEPFDGEGGKNYTLIFSGIVS